MSFQRYPAYKQSGVEWLGRVPEGWSVTNLKRGFQVTLGKMLQPAKKSDDELLLPYLRAANVSWVGVDASDIKKMWISGKEREHLRLSPGDLLVSEGGDVGRSCLWKSELSECYFQNSLNRVRPKEGNSTRFLYYWMVTIKNKGFVDVLCNKSTIAHFTAEKLQEVTVPFPSADEQLTIANFLDHETAKIDALIADQEKLIELLKEKRQAVISHAVTKGLDPNVKMKDSGVEWLGQVPEHWEIKKIKYLATFSGGGTPNREVMDYWNGSIPWVSPKDMKSSAIEESEERITEKGLLESSTNLIPEGSVLLVVRSGILKHTIPVGINTVSVAINQDMKALSFAHSDCLNMFFMRWVQGLMVTLLQAWSKQGATVESLEHECIAETVFYLPPKAEQLQIIKFLQESVASIEALISTSTKGIEILLERRSALISAAVTGQIDVRNFVPEAEQA